MKNKSKHQGELLVVGIASSAGGLGPLKELIARAVCHGNMCFILVPHLSRDFESQLPHLLKPITSLNLQVITHEMELEACRLYVLPPGFYARVNAGKIYLDVRPERGPNLSANVLFKSLAENYGRNAIGVVLSGAAAGLDGSEGVRDIKSHLGHTYAQDPLTAEFASMPEAAIETDCIDFILSPEKIGDELTLVSWASDKLEDENVTPSAFAKSKKHDRRINPF